MPSKLRGLVLAVHPMARGVGWVIFESPLAPVDWAIARSPQNAKCLSFVERVVDRYAPAVLVIEEFERGPAGRAARIRRLCLGPGSLE